MKTQTLYIGILEDDDGIRNSYHMYLSRNEQFNIVIEAASVEDFIHKMKDIGHLDVVLSDIGLPGKSGVEGIYLIKDRFPDCNILMFTVYNDADRIFNSLCAGASGYLLKNTPFSKVAEALLEVYNGDAPMSPSIARKVIDYFNPKKVNLKQQLTSREQQIVQSLVDGLSYKMIADRYEIGFETVKHHIKNIYKKLHVNSKSEVIAMALKHKI